jgi:hypothetical protein
MKTKRHYKKHNKLTKANNANKTNKKIGGGKEKIPDILKKSDIRTFNGIKYDTNTEEGINAYDQAVKDSLGPLGQNVNENEKKPDKPNQKQVPKKKWGYKIIATGMFFTGLFIGIPLLVIKPDKIN